MEMYEDGDEENISVTSREDHFAYWALKLYSCLDNFLSEN